MKENHCRKREEDYKFVNFSQKQTYGFSNSRQCAIMPTRMRGTTSLTLLGTAERQRQMRLPLLIGGTDTSERSQKL